MKSSSIQVGDLIIVEKVCWRLSYPYPFALKHFECDINVTENEVGSCLPLLLCLGGSG